MNETEWLSARRPARMLAWLHKKKIDVQLGFFAFACLCRAWPCLQDVRIKEAIFAIESFIRSREALANLQECWYAQHARLTESNWGLSQTLIAGTVLSILQTMTWDRPDALANTLDRTASTVANALWIHPGREESKEAERYDSLRELEKQVYREQADKLRCIAGNPFQPLRPHQAWRTPTVLDLAAAAYANCDPLHNMEPDRLLVLSDALEDAGCTDAYLLQHLRGQDSRDGVHYRECFYLSHLLNKDMPARPAFPV